MNIKISQISGLADAITSMYMSKRSWTREKEQEIRKLVFFNTMGDGTVPSDPEIYPQFKSIMDTLIKYGVEEGHTTLLRFIDITITVEGLHRAAQDDFDSHAARLNNRIVRSSTRLATFNETEKSEWYQDKILYPLEVLKLLHFDLPETVENNGIKFIKTDFGYVNQEYATDKDAKRGLYPLAIPSNFIAKAQYPEMAHIVQHRDINSHANPELKSMIEQFKVMLTQMNPWLGDNIMKVKMQK